MTGPRWRSWRSAWQDALYGAGGFYRRPEGPAGHFETSANGPGGAGGHLGALAAGLAALAARHGCDHVVDVGAGRGELLAALRQSAAGGGSGALRLTGVDVVPRPPHLDPAIAWMTGPGGPGLPGELADLDGALVLAHEWLDVVPCDVVEVDDDATLRLVEVDPRTGRERLGAEAGEDVRNWCRDWWPLEGAAPGSRAEVGTARDAAWADLARRVRRGACLAVDYGHVRAHRPPTGSLAAHRGGHLVRPVPDGSCDLTAHVAVDSLPGPGPGQELRLQSQREALLDLGVGAARPPLEFAREDPSAYLRQLAEASAAATLLDPGGQGGLTWAFAAIGPAPVRPPAGHGLARPDRVEPCSAPAAGPCLPVEDCSQRSQPA